VEVAPDFIDNQCLTRFTDKAIEWMSGKVADAKQGKPFFLYLPYTSPHYPVCPLPEYEGQGAAGAYGEFVIETDHHIGQILDFLKTSGLDENTLIVHGIWLNDDDIEIIAKNHVKVSHDPESNMKLAAGIAPVPGLLKAGVTVGLGTDGCASNNDLDLFREMDTAAKLHKVNLLDPTVMDAVTVLKMATREGAKAIGLDNHIGSLEPGKQADVIIIDTDSPHLVPMYEPASHLVYTAQGSDVRDVMIAGRILVRNKNLLTLDLEDILERVTRLSESIRKK